MTDIKEAQGLEVVAWQDAENPLYATGEKRQMHAWATDGYPIVELVRLSDATAVIDQLREQVAELEAQLVGYDKISRDANRYRWFRWNASESFYGNEVINLVNDPVSLDRAIDARLNRSKTNEQ